MHFWLTETSIGFIIGVASYQQWYYSTPQTAIVRRAEMDGRRTNRNLECLCCHPTYQASMINLSCHHQDEPLYFPHSGGSEGHSQRDYDDMCEGSNTHSLCLTKPLIQYSIRHQRNKNLQSFYAGMQTNYSSFPNTLPLVNELASVDKQQALINHKPPAY